jgi:hypothetical protein
MLRFCVNNTIGLEIRWTDHVDRVKTSGRVDHGVVYTERRVRGRQTRLWKEHSEDGAGLKLPNL